MITVRPSQRAATHARTRGGMPRAMATGRSAARLVATCLLLATCVGTAEVRLPIVTRAVPGASRFPIRARPRRADRVSPRRPRARLRTAARRASTARSRPSARSASPRCATTPCARRARSRWTTACCVASPAGVTMRCTARTRWRRGRSTSNEGGRSDRARARSCAKRSRRSSSGRRRSDKKTYSEWMRLFCAMGACAM